MEKRTCPFCAKALRSDNTKGVCGKCQAKGRLAENAPATPTAEADTSIYDVKTSGEAAPRRRAKAEKSALQRFRIVAEALGEDAEGLLEAFAESWLEQLKGRVGAGDE
jgi:hypothetical protein